MKRIFKILLILLAVVTVIFIGTGLYIANKKPAVYENKAPEITVTADSAMIAEGARMSKLLCAECHGGSDGKLSGAYMPDAKMFGDIYAPNITKSTKAAISGYTDGEIIYLLRTGIKKDGYYAPPWMPKFPLMSDKDIQSVVAFLRSDHPSLEASEVVQPKSKPSFLAKALTIFAFKPLTYPETEIFSPDTANKIIWGEYLSTAKFDCFGCHSADFATVNLEEPAKSIGFFGGGNTLFNKEGEPVVSANITMDVETGIGNWTEEEFIKCVRFGERKSGIPTAYPMMPMSNLTDAEVSAIWAYLQTVPVLSKPKKKA